VRTTPNVGDIVVVVDYATKELRSTEMHTVTSVMNQKSYPGGVTIAPPFDGIQYWNADSLRRLKRAYQPKNG
jgi:hypothetical protein